MESGRRSEKVLWRARPSAKDRARGFLTKQRYISASGFETGDRKVGLSKDGGKIRPDPWRMVKGWAGCWAAKVESYRRVPKRGPAERLGGQEVAGRWQASGRQVTGR